MYGDECGISILYTDKSTTSYTIHTDAKFQNNPSAQFDLTEFGNR